MLSIPAAPDILNSQTGRDNSIHRRHFGVISSALYRNTLSLFQALLAVLISSICTVLFFSPMLGVHLSYSPITSTTPSRRPHISESRDTCLVSRISSRRPRYWIRGKISTEILNAVCPSRSTGNKMRLPAM
jgi:hypothetical protein